MSIRMSISQAAVAVLAGCGVAATTEYTAADQAVLAATATGPVGEAGVVTCLPNSPNPPNAACLVTCPDPKTDCTHPNGPGIFFEELGSAGINAPGEHVMMMITAFTNKASSVTFRGRYTDPFADPKQYPFGLWLWTDGTIDSADYKNALGLLQVGLQVVNVSEQNTMPTWTLVDPKGSTPPKQVSGDSLVGLTLHATFTVVSPALTPVHVLLTFEQPDIVYDTDPDGHVFYNHPVLHAYTLRWRPEGAAPEESSQYCYRGSKHPEPDKVVFQQGISVDPVNGTVTPVPNDVTISCSWGAVAKVYNWGYSYVPQDGSVPFLYQAAIHMKRAAYCGNWNYYTIDGINIGIRDNLDINTYKPPPATPLELEARWDSQGATCVNLANLRHPDSPPGTFDGACSPKPLLKCDPLPPGSTFIESYKVPQKQDLPSP